MDSHEDNPLQRFLAYWGAFFATFAFGVLALIMVAVTSGTAARAKVNPDDERRTKLDQETIAAQKAAIGAWKKNDDGTIQAPPSAVLPKMVNKLEKAAASAVPVPGTKAAEAAAAAAAAQQPAPAPAPAKP